MSAKQVLLVVNVFATDMTDARRQAYILAKEYDICELLDVVCTDYSWEQVEHEKLFMFRIIYSILMR